MNDPISAEEYFRGTLKLIAHWSEVDLSGEWETGLRGVIRSITDTAREVLSAHPETNPGAALAEPATVAADLDSDDARPNRGLDSSDRGHNETLIRQLREIATEFAIDNKTDCKQHVCWIAADTLARSSERTSEQESIIAALNGDIHELGQRAEDAEAIADAFGKITPQQYERELSGAKAIHAATVESLRLCLDQRTLLMRALAEIKRATVEGRVCDDVAWFDQIETLHDFCERTLDAVSKSGEGS